MQPSHDKRREEYAPKNVQSGVVPAGSTVSQLEIELVPPGIAASSVTPHCFVEVHTRNHVYGCDAAFVCVHVRRSDDGHELRTHALLGAKLRGGVLRQPKGRTVASPLPIPGMVAVFDQSGREGAQSTHTSQVLAVRVRVQTLDLTGGDDADETIPPPRASQR